MHLNKILEQIKRHQSPTEAIDKLATALEKHEGSLLEKGFTILKSELAANMYEAINGPHFDEEHAHYAVEGMENEDGTKGPHWTVEETTSVLGICPKVWCQLPREGVMVFEARHTPAEASAELPVLISPTGSVSPAANTKNIPVVKADSSPLTGSEIAAGNRYFIYYNKCDNVMQIMNHYPTAAPAA